MKPSETPSIPTLSSGYGPKEEIEHLIARMKTIALAAKEVKGPADQAQVALYLRELNLKVLGLRKLL